MISSAPKFNEIPNRLYRIHNVYFNSLTCYTTFMLMFIYDSACCTRHVSIELCRLGISLFRLFDATRTRRSLDHSASYFSQSPRITRHALQIVIYTPSNELRRAALPPSTTPMVHIRHHLFQLSCCCCCCCCYSCNYFIVSASNTTALAMLWRIRKWSCFDREGLVVGRKEIN